MTTVYVTRAAGYLQVAEVGDATPKPRRRRPLRKLNAPAKDIMAAAADTDVAAAGNSGT